MRIGFLATLLLLVQTATAQTAENHLSYPPMDPGGEMDLIETATESEELFVRRRLIFQDPELQAIIDRVLADVTPGVRDKYINYRVHLIRDPSPLGFSFADGQIYLHTGLLARLENEAQLAAVLAHEAHHVAAHDHIKTTDARRTKGEVFGAVDFALSGVRDSNIRPEERNALFNNLRTEFDEETEIMADAATLAILTVAKYPTAAAVQLIEHLMKDPELAASQLALNDAQLDGTHYWNPINRPANYANQLANRHALLQQQVPVGIVTTAPRPLLVRRIIEMTINDYIRLDRPGTAVEFTDALIAIQPDAFLLAAKGDAYLALGPRPVVEGPERWKWQTAKRERLTRDELVGHYMATEEGPARLVENTQTAMTAFNDALAMNENSGRAHRGLGNVYFDDADYRNAGRHYIKYLKIEPETNDRTMVVEKLQHIRNELTAQKETAQ
jgi:predicted Zn-dependent protease